jgi:hypothetical protein
VVLGASCVRCLKAYSSGEEHLVESDCYELRNLRENSWEA